MKNAFNRTFYTKDHKQLVSLMHALSSIVVNAPHIMFRTNTHNLSVDHSDPRYTSYDDIDSFVVLTSANPESRIIYTSPTNDVDLNIRDGGYF